MSKPSNPRTTLKVGRNELERLRKLAEENKCSIADMLEIVLTGYISKQPSNLTGGQPVAKRFLCGVCGLSYESIIEFREHILIVEGLIYETGLWTHFLR